MRQSKSFVFSDFSGGLNADASPTSLEMNQALDLDNIILLPKSGFKQRNGNSLFNSSAMASGAAVHGIGYYRQIDGDEWLMSVCGTGIFKSEMDGTMDTITGAVTVTTGQDNFWSYAQMNDTAIFVGGSRATDVPFKWTGTGNAAILAGTPPVGKWTIQANNRLFIGNTVANPSRVNWSILGNPEDWTGAGSGSQDISTNDGDEAVGAALVGTDHLLIFKQSSIHEMIIRNSPFPVFPFKRNVGAAGPGAIVNVDGVIYFVTTETRMKATDGVNITEFPDTIDSIWDSIVTNRIRHIQGFYDRKRSLILWFCTVGVATTNNYCIVWDLVRKTWLKFTTGHSMNVVTMAQDRRIFAGGYDGKLYELDDADEMDDASESTTIVTSYWRSGWIDYGEMINQKSIPYMDINFKTSDVDGSAFTLDYGFDFNVDQKQASVSLEQGGTLYGTGIYDTDVYGGVTDRTKLEFTKGHGKFFQFKLTHARTGETFQINRVALPVKDNGPFALR